MELSPRALADYRLAMAMIERQRTAIERGMRKNVRRRVQRASAKHVEVRRPTPRTREDWLDMVYGIQELAACKNREEIIELVTNRRMVYGR